MPPLRRLFLLAGVITATALVIYVVAFFYVLRAGAEDQRRTVDAIVVLGAAQYDGRPSPVLQARLDHALVLYEQGLARWVVVTGGVGTGDTASEAAVGKRYLESKDVPQNVLVARPEGRSTGASMEALANWLDREDLGTVLLVSDPFHMGRLRLEANRLGIEAYTSPTRTSPISASISGELSYVATEALKVPVAWLGSWNNRRE